MDGFRGNRLGHTAPEWNTVRLCPQGTKDLSWVRRGLQTDGDRDLSGKGRRPWPHPSSVTLTSLSLFKLPPLPPLVQNVIFWPQGCQGGDQGWSRAGGWCWSSKANISYGSM